MRQNPSHAATPKVSLLKGAPCLGRSSLRCLKITAHWASTAKAPTAKAAIFTGAYATAAGMALAIAPITTLGLIFDAAVVPKGWIRVGGILFALIGLQYMGTGLGDNNKGERGDSFYRATVWSRLFLAAGFALVVALGELPVTLLLLSALNLIGSLSMAVAIKKNEAELKSQCEKAS